MTISRFLASGFGAGFSPWAPGTAGSLLGLCIGEFLLRISHLALLGFVILAAILGCQVIANATGQKVFGAQAAAPHDPGWVVIDEIAGQCIALAALPRASWAGAFAAFAAFRLFDITKPGPVGWADRRGGAVAIMLDDVIAGGMAAACVFMLHLYRPGIF
jgi:phosphatidylglycerophosphatase A